MKSLLLVDDEPVINVELQKALQRSQYDVEMVPDVESAQRILEDRRFDLIIIELNARENAATPAHPVIGARLVRKLRDRGIEVPILIHSSLSDDMAYTASIDAGANEYIVKRSASFRILLARIKAHFRRDERLSVPDAVGKRWIGTRDIRLDREEQKLSVGHVSITLNAKETRIMEVLTSNPAKTFSSEEIVSRVWGSDPPCSNNALARLIYSLRSKFKDHHVEDLIENPRDGGYRIVLSSVINQ